MVCRKMAAGAVVIFLISYLCASACGAEKKDGKIGVASGAFKDGGMIPQKYAFHYENYSPPLAWSNIPEGARSIAIICDDPDAPSGTWVHWVVFNIPAGTEGVPEGASRERALPDGSRQGVNDFKKIGYDGPAPPYGVHRYVFTVFALDIMLDLKEGATKKELLDRMSGHVVGEGKLTGRYKSKF